MGYANTRWLLHSGALALRTQRGPGHRPCPQESCDQAAVHVAPALASLSGLEPSLGLVLAVWPRSAFLTEFVKIKCCAMCVLTRGREEELIIKSQAPGTQANNITASGGK